MTTFLNYVAICYGFTLAMALVCLPVFYSSRDADDKRIAEMLASFISWHITAPVAVVAYIWACIRGFIRFFCPQTAKRDDDKTPRQWIA